MMIRIGDKVEVKETGLISKDAIITDIRISINKTDRSGERGICLKELDLDLLYQGTITYKDITFNDEGDNEGPLHWAYFYQIKESA